MTYHACHCPGINAGFVAHPIGSVPFFAGKAVYAGNQMLISFVGSVSGKMFDGCGKPFFLNSFHKHGSHPCYSFRIGAEGAGIGDGIMVLIVDIYDGGKCPVCADGSGFSGTYGCHFPDCFGIVRGSGFHGGSEGGAFFYYAVPAFFQIGCNQRGNFGQLRYFIGQCNGSFQRKGTVHHSARYGAEACKDFSEFFIASASGIDTEELGEFLPFCHFIQSIGYPSYFFVV